MDIRVDDLSGEGIQNFILHHVTDAHQNSPANKVHALDISCLQKIRYYILVCMGG